MSETRMRIRFTGVTNGIVAARALRSAMMTVERVKGDRISAGGLSLECHEGEIVAAARGEDAQECLEDMVAVMEEEGVVDSHEYLEEAGSV